MKLSARPKRSQLSKLLLLSGAIAFIAVVSVFASPSKNSNHTGISASSIKQVSKEEALDRVLARARLDDSVSEESGVAGDKNKAPRTSDETAGDASAAAAVAAGHGGQSEHADGQFGFTPVSTGAAEFSAQINGFGNDPSEFGSNSNGLGDSISPSNLLQQMLSGLGFIPGVAGPGRGTKLEVELPAGKVNQQYCTTIESAGNDPTKIFTVVRGFVAKGLILNRSTGALCGTPSESGIFRFTIRVSGSMQAADETNYKLVVSEQAPKTEGELRIASSQLPVGKIGAEYVFQLQATGGKAPYFWSASGLPDGLELDADSGLIGGSPGRTGNFSVAVLVRDTENKSSSANLELIVRTTPVFISTRSLGEGAINEAFQARLAAQGGVPPYRWELVGAVLPEGLEFSPASGVIEGVPTKVFSGTIAVRVVDTEKKNDTADLALEIRENLLRIVNDALADGFETSPYSFTLSGEGGVPPYHWSASAIAPGLELDPVNGTISGTPSAKGEYSISVGLQDAEENQTSRVLRLRIAALESTPTPTPTPDETDEEPKPDATPEPQPTVINPGTGGTNSTPTPTPTPPLPAVTELSAIGSREKVGLSWRNPVHPDFLRTVVVRGNGDIESPDQGTTVYSGTDDSAIDLNLEMDQSYSYAAFAQYSAGSNAPAPARATATTRVPSIDSKPDPFIDDVVNFSPLDPGGCFQCSSVPQIVLGPPAGTGESTGSLDVVSLNAKVNSDGGSSGPYGGTITLQFTDNIVFNGPGPDFTIFENAFRIPNTDLYFVEPAVVEVSADGNKFYRFPFDFVPHYNDDGSLNLFNPFCYASGFAGIHPVYSNKNLPSPLNPTLSGGDQFDLSDLPGAPLSWIRFIRITSTGDNWLLDLQGDAVRHSNSSPFFGASGKGNSGFDLDAIAALNF